MTRFPSVVPRCLLAATALLGAGLGASTPAQAQSGLSAETVTALEFKLLGEAGDSVGPPTTDITSATVVQDRENGVIRVEVTLAEDPSGTTDFIHVNLGFLRFGGCEYGYGRAGTLHLLTSFSETTARWWVTAPTEVGGGVTRAAAGQTVTMVSLPDKLMTGNFRCVVVETLPMLPDGVADGTRPYDSLTAITAREVTKPTGPVAGPPVAGKIDIIDSDGDAVPDASDKCRDLPGAGLDGCPTTPPARSVKLGAKRVAIDRMVKRTGPSCPGYVKAKVAAKGRTLGTQKIGTVQRGTYCHVNGVVRLKKGAKKARVSISGAGVETTKVVVTR